METRHLDGDPGNNALSNLCWGTRQENAQDKVRHGRGGKRMTTEQACHVLRLLADGLSERQVAKRMGISQPAVHAIKTGRSHRGALASLVRYIS